MKHCVIVVLMSSIVIREHGFLWATEF